MSETAIEKEIQEKGLTAPRITPADIDARMSQVTYWVQCIPKTTTTVAVSFDENGFSIATKISACASPENFDEEIGKKIALEGCEALTREELWRLEGYKLKRDLNS